ncbi:MAG: DNA mismatch repair endonuclease MutL [Ignavibacteria bacterium]|nr:DNA mismatch repair endonuclease MutL [Ignavibacteria bacterium]
MLPPHIANRIAAGEVVGRPEAVVKELIENSLDAGATYIELIVKDAGKSLIQVIDNGKGMSPEDAALCFQRHATSKIFSPEDLEKILTYGFRGEALASIASVSQVELKTKTKDSELGTLIRNHGNEFIENKPVNTDTGTSVSVKNLFYNTPARRNFLKSNQTEFRYIYETFVRLALANTSVCFRFINEDEIILDLTKSDLLSRLKNIYGQSLTDKLLPVKDSNPNISVDGYISKPDFTKKSRAEQFFFLNGRYIISKSLSFAVASAYDDLIEKGNYPSFFIFMELEPDKFDVNVHPSKLEVKFEDEKAIFSIIHRLVRKTLEQNDLVFSVNPQTSSGNKKIIPISEHQGKTGKISAYRDSFKFRKHPVSNVHELFTGPDEYKTLNQTDKTENLQDKTSDYSEDSLISKNEIWQFQKKYIMYQFESYLMIIDQHAAHERILYEQALQRLESGAGLSQQLLIPITIELNPVDYEILGSLENELKSLGFSLELQSKRKVKVTGVPSDVKVGNEATILQELIDQFKEYDVKLNLEKRDNLAKSYACKHAVKAGDFLSENEMLSLIDQLFSTSTPYVCPHGRPTIVRISTDELDKMFARKGL